MAETKDFTTTKLCGRRVAGRAVEAGKEGQELQLTADEAAYELGQGTIVPKGKELSKAFAEGGKAITALREGIVAEEARYAAVRANARTAPVAVQEPAAADPAAPAAPPIPAAGGKPAGAAKAV